MTLKKFVRRYYRANSIRNPLASEVDTLLSAQLSQFKTFYLEGYMRYGASEFPTGQLYEEWVMCYRIYKSVVEIVEEMEGRNA
jgi:hypothetical protein